MSQGNGSGAGSVRSARPVERKGKNMKTTYPFVADARVETLSGSELELFNYGNSETISFARR